MLLRILAAVALLALGQESEAQGLTPFDVTDPTSRTVVIYFDHDTDDPSLLGSDMRFGFFGQWITIGSVGFAFVTPDEVAAKLVEINSPGVATDLGSWTSLQYAVDIPTRRITITQSAVVDIACLNFNDVDIDVTLDTFSTATPTWDTTSVPPCPAFAVWSGGTFAGAAPFNYDDSTGRFNAVGPIELVPLGLERYGTFGDAQFFELAATPALSPGGHAVAAVALGALALRELRRRRLPSVRARSGWRAVSRSR